VKILVTGASGFVGCSLVPVLINARYNVFVCNRRKTNSPFSGKVKTYLVSEIGPNTNWTEALSGIDAVVHLAGRAHFSNNDLIEDQAAYDSINAVGTEHLAKSAAQAGVKKFIFISTVKVMGEKSFDLPFTETQSPNPIDAYGKSKLAGEAALLRVSDEFDMGVVILRPPLLYGPGVKANMLRLLKLCQLSVPLPFAAVSNQRSLLYVGNLVDAIMVCLENAKANGQTYFVCDGNDISTSTLIQKISVSLNKPAYLFSVPNFLLRLVGRIIGKSLVVERLIENLQVSDKKIRTQLGWTPPFNMIQGLDMMATWFKTKEKL
jgi:nucleoside-diphosphate-sugar epimerase